MTTDQVLPTEDPQAHRRADPEARKPADQRQRAGDVAGLRSRTASSGSRDAAARR